jgi:hypothetical protein
MNTKQIMMRRSSQTRIQRRRKSQLNYALVVLWGLFLSIHTWTANLGALLRLQSISFKWVSSPNFLEFFYFYDLSSIHSYWMLVKFGHFTGFGIMNLFLYNWTKNYKLALIVSIFYAFFTEFLQLFFGRDGRLYDLIIDSLGIITVYYLLKAKRKPKRQIHRPNQQ